MPSPVWVVKVTSCNGRRDLVQHAFLQSSKSQGGKSWMWGSHLIKTAEIHILCASQVFGADTSSHPPLPPGIIVCDLHPEPQESHGHLPVGHITSGTVHLENQEAPCQLSFPGIREPWTPSILTSNGNADPSVEITMIPALPTHLAQSCLRTSWGSSFYLKGLSSGQDRHPVKNQHRSTDLVKTTLSQSSTYDCLVFFLSIN